MSSESDITRVARMLREASEILEKQGQAESENQNSNSTSRHMPTSTSTSSATSPSENQSTTTSRGNISPWTWSGANAAQPWPRQEASSGPSRSSNNNPNMLQQTLEQTQRMIQASSSRGLFRRMNLNERLRASSNTPYPASRNRLNNKNIRNNRIYCNITQILPACFYKRVSYKKNPCISISKLLDRISAKVPLGLSW